MKRISRQMLLALFTVVCCSTLSFAKSLPKSQSDVLKDLSKDFSFVSWNSKRAEIEKHFGKSKHQSSDGESIFLSYDLPHKIGSATFAFKKNELQSVFFLFQKQKWVAADFQNLVSADEVKDGEILSQKSKRHTAGDQFTAISMKNGIAVMIENDKDLSVKALTFWEPGKPQP